MGGWGGGSIIDEWTEFGSGVLAGGCVLLTAKLPTAVVTQQQRQPAMTPPFLLLSQRPLGFVVGGQNPVKEGGECSRRVGPLTPPPPPRTWMGTSPSGGNKEDMFNYGETGKKLPQHKGGPH